MFFTKNADEAIHTISESKGGNDGSSEKVALHSFVAGITTKLGGNSFAEGALVGGVNEVALELTQEEKDKEDEEYVKEALERII